MAKNLRLSQRDVRVSRLFIVASMTVRQYAEHRGISRQAIDKAVKEKRLAKSLIQTEPMILIDAYLADREWAQTTKPAANPSGVAASQRPEKPERDRVGGDDLNGYEAVNHAHEKALKERALRKMAEIALGKMERSVVSVEDAERLWFRHWRSLRDRLLAIPERESAGLAAETDPLTVSLALRRAISAALDELPESAPIPEPAK